MKISISSGNNEMQSAFNCDVGCSANNILRNRQSEMKIKWEYLPRIEMMLAHVSSRLVDLKKNFCLECRVVVLL